MEDTDNISDVESVVSSLDLDTAVVRGLTGRSVFDKHSGDFIELSNEVSSCLYSVLQRPLTSEAVEECCPTQQHQHPGSRPVLNARCQRGCDTFRPPAQSGVCVEDASNIKLRSIRTRLRDDACICASRTKVWFPSNATHATYATNATQTTQE